MYLASSKEQKCKLDVGMNQHQGREIRTWISIPAALIPNNARTTKAEMGIHSHSKVGAKANVTTMADINNPV